MNKEHPTHDRLGNPINWHPLKAREPNQKENALTKKIECWCGYPKCQCWGNHITKDHEAWYKTMCKTHKK